jgi:hypothetical protein
METITMDKEIKEKVIEYVQKNYPNKYGKKELIVEEGNNIFYVKANHDESPLILGKGIV